MATQDSLDLLEAHPFDHLDAPDEKRRIQASVDRLIVAYTAIKDIRLAVGVAQTTVADGMGVSKSAVAQLEGRDIEAIHIGTLDRYFAALGYRLHFELESIDA